MGWNFFGSSLIDVFSSSFLDRVDTVKQANYLPVEQVLIMPQFGFLCSHLPLSLNKTTGLLNAERIPNLRAEIFSIGICGGNLSTPYVGNVEILKTFTVWFGIPLRFDEFQGKGK